MFTEWLLFVGLVLAAFIALALPGWLLLRLVSLRDARALLLAPAIGIGLYGLLTLVAIPIGGWSLWYPGALIIMLAVAVGTKELVGLRKRRDCGTDSNPPKRYQLSPLWFALGGIGAFLLAYLPSIISIWDGPANPQALGDAAFHAQGSLLVWLSGDVSPLSALSSIFDPASLQLQGDVAMLHSDAGGPVTVLQMAAEQQTYYPTLWHALTSLMVSVVPVAEASNVLNIVIGLIVWPLSLSAFALSVAPRKYPSVALWAPLVASLSAIYPGLVLFGFSIAPFGLSIPLLPSAVAVAVLMFRRHTTMSQRSRWVLVWLVLAVGAATAQPSTLALVIIGSVAVALVAVTAGLVALARRGHAVVAALAAVAIVVCIIGLLVLIDTSSFIRSIHPFERYIYGLRYALWMLTQNGYQLSYVLVAVALVVGVLVGFRSLRGQMALWVIAAFGVVLAVAASPAWPLHSITAIWYRDTERLSIPVVMAASALAAIGIAAAQAWCVRRMPANKSIPAFLGALVIVLILGANTISIRTPARTPGEYMELGYSLESGAINMLDHDRVQIIGEIGRLAPEGAYIAGPPSAGAEFVASLSDSLAFSVLNPPLSDSQRLIASGLDKIREDPEVCQVVSSLGLWGVMLTDMQPDGDEYASHSGFFDLDPSEGGFELVAESGPIQLWKITECD